MTGRFRIHAVLVSGIPASGKTTFGEWVLSRLAGTHVDLEGDGLVRHGLSGAWSHLWSGSTPDGAAFAESVRQLPPPVAVTWGYPPGCLPVVSALHRAGLEAWWFDGDRDAARLSFARRGTVSDDAHRIQIAEIERRWPDLAAFYGDRVIRTINSIGEYANWEEIFLHIFDRRQVVE